MAEITILNDYLEDEPTMENSQSLGLLKGKFNKIGDLIKFQI